LYWYGWKLGFDLARRGHLRDALPYLIRPVNYWRDIEYRLVRDALDVRASDRVLDVGSPKLLSLFLAEHVGATTSATDIEDYFIERMRIIKRVRGIPDGRLPVAVEDGRKLTFADNTFDKAYAISVLEHIPDDGDSTCIAELRRVLVPGGVCAITVPFSPQSKVEFGDSYWSGSSRATDDGRVFYQRRYSEEDLRRRLIEPSGMRLRSLHFVGDRFMLRGREFSDYLPAVSGPLQPMLSRIVHTRPARDWRKLKHPLCAALTFEKR
jgi:SAM-dependent methyltransferase